MKIKTKPPVGVLKSKGVGRIKFYKSSVAGCVENI